MITNIIIFFIIIIFIYLLTSVDGYYILYLLNYLWEDNDLTVFHNTDKDWCKNLRENYKEIRTLIENENPEKINNILLFKYKLRGKFLANYNMIAENLKNRIEKNKDYKLMFFDEIFNDIISKYG